VVIAGGGCDWWL